MKLIDMGWDDNAEKHFIDFKNEGYIPAKVVTQNRNNYYLLYEEGVLNAKLSGKLFYELKKHQLPVVGDWVVTKSKDEVQAIIYGVLPRKTAFSRKLPISGGRKIRNGVIVGGVTEEQVIAANVDMIFIVTGLDENFNIQRIERYITLAYNSGAIPVIILNKADCCQNIEEYEGKVRKVASGIQIHAVSATKNLGMDVFNQYLRPGKTVVFLGSSGVGKSTISNYLLGKEQQKTGETSSSSGKGRHTTTSSQLLFHDSGCMIIDTPGIKELQLWCNEEAIEESFEDVIEIIHSCKYRDCRHETEPGCAVKQALADGTLNPERLESYNKLILELQRLNGRLKQSEQYLSKREKLYAKINQRGHK